MTIDTTLRVYVGTYAKYDSRNLSGKWIDLEDYDSHEEFIAACRQIHKDESDPELMFQDYESPSNKMIGESFVSEHCWEFMLLSEEEQRAALALMHDGEDLEQACDSPSDRVIVIDCGYEHNAAETYFDNHWCEMNHETVEKLEELHVLGYLDQEAIFRDADANNIASWIENIGLCIWMK